LLNHTSISTTENYIPGILSQKELRDIYNEIHTIKNSSEITSLFDKDKTELQIEEDIYNLIENEIGNQD